MKKVFTSKPSDSMILFDFDGTLVDSLEQVVGIINRLGSTFGYTIDATHIETFREEGGESFFYKSGIKRLVMPLILHEVIKEQAKDIEQLMVFPGLLDVLTQLHQRGFRMGIVSSNGEENVKSFLARDKISHLFEVVYTGGGLFGKDKEIERVIQDLRLNKEAVVYVGDEVRDIEAAHQAGVRVVSVSWGYHARKALLKSCPDWTVDKPNALLSLLVGDWWWKRLLFRVGF